MCVEQVNSSNTANGILLRSSFTENKKGNHDDRSLCNTRQNYERSVIYNKPKNYDVGYQDVQIDNSTGNFYDIRYLCPSEYDEDVDLLNITLRGYKMILLQKKP